MSSEWPDCVAVSPSVHAALPALIWPCCGGGSPNLSSMAEPLCLVPCSSPLCCNGLHTALLAHLVCSVLQELHASNCIGITAADLETVASALTSSLTVLDISLNTAQPDGGDLRGSIDALGRLTNLQHLNAFGSCIAPVGDGSEGGVCSILAQLTQLTFLSVGSVQRSVMVMPADDVAHLSALTGLKKLQIAGAQLGVGLGGSQGPLHQLCCS